MIIPNDYIVLLSKDLFTYFCDFSFTVWKSGQNMSFNKHDNSSSNSEKEKKTSWDWAVPSSELLGWKLRITKCWGWMKIGVRDMKGKNVRLNNYGQVKL